MKKIIYFIVLSLITFSSYADRKVLIDFNLLKANCNVMEPDKINTLDYNKHDSVNVNQHAGSMLDYSIIAGDSFNGDEKKNMKVSLACYNWDIILNASSASVANKRDSYCTEWHTKPVSSLEDKSDHQPLDPVPGYTILAVRVRFPTIPFNSWALIQPPFDIPVYESKPGDASGDKFENGLGVIKNVGIIKRIEMRVYGMNYRNTIAVLLEDDKNGIREYDFTHNLEFDGWRKIEWTNPNYITNVTHRDLFVVPLYPNFEPYIKLKGFRIYRPGDQVGGNFITYIKDVYITYDQAVLRKDDEPIEHEALWGILQKKALEIREMEVKKIGYKHILRFLERMKMHKE